ncbi:MAG TPA: thioesterase family protein [Sphingomonadales bacterium]|nr:thioesterase family protein [Sphingomonadales bacterium]
MKEFVHNVKIRFGHVDAAGIVFHPRYFEMANDAIEDWFSQLGFPFSDMHLKKEFGVPLVHIEADFLRPTRLGDELALTLTVSKMGRSSLELNIAAACRGEARFVMNAVIAYVDLKKGKAAEWNPAIKAAIAGWLKD